MLTYELVKGVTPFRVDIDINRIISDEPDYSGIESRCVNFIKRCLIKDAKKRSSL